LSDPKGETARRYGVTDAVKKWASRWTFIIGKDGKILYIDRNVDPARHVDDLVKKLDELNVAKK
jgi:peroxiredoxin Q/BCP